MVQVHFPNPKPEATQVPDQPPPTAPTAAYIFPTNEVPGYVVNMEKHKEAKLSAQQAAFSDEGTRYGFIQKVLALILLQSLAVEGIIVIFAANYYSIRYGSMYELQWLYIVVSAIGFAGCLGALAYFTEARKKCPYKYLFFIMLPGTLGCLLSVAFFHIAEELTYAWSFFCAGLALMLLQNIFSFQSNFKFSFRNAINVNLALVFVLYAITRCVAPYYVSNIAVFLFTLGQFAWTNYILCAVLVMAGKNYRFDITPSDAVISVLNLHIDGCYLFKLWHNNQLKAALGDA